jgi:hypothetical protein
MYSHKKICLGCPASQANRHCTHFNIRHVGPSSIVQEVVEELHIPQEHLDTQNALMLGLVRRLPNMRYQLVMELDCLLTKAQVTVEFLKSTSLSPHMRMAPS